MANIYRQGYANVNLWISVFPVYKNSLYIYGTNSNHTYKPGSYWMNLVIFPDLRKKLVPRRQRF